MSVATFKNKPTSTVAPTKNELSAINYCNVLYMIDIYTITNINLRQPQSKPSRKYILYSIIVYWFAPLQSIISHTTHTRIHQFPWDWPASRSYQYIYTVKKKVSAQNLRNLGPSGPSISYVPFWLFQAQIFLCLTLNFDWIILR